MSISYEISQINLDPLIPYLILDILVNLDATETWSGCNVLAIKQTLFTIIIIIRTYQPSHQNRRGKLRLLADKHPIWEVGR